MRLEGKSESTLAQFRFGRQRQQPFSQGSEGDLRASPLERRARQAEQHIAAAVEVGRAAARVMQFSRTLVEAGAVAFDLENPARGLRKPVAQFLGVAPHGAKSGIRRRHQGTHQQGAQGVAPFVFAMAA